MTLPLPRNEEKKVINNSENSSIRSNIHVIYLAKFYFVYAIILVWKEFTLSHLGDLIRSQPGAGDGIRPPPPPPVTFLSLIQIKLNLLW